MRIATYNVEWFYRLFDAQGQILDDDAWSARRNVTRAQQIGALAHVFQAMDADAIMVIEAPDSHGGRDGVAALETFARRYGLRARRALMGFVNDTRQEIALMYDPDVLTVSHAPSQAGAPQFDGEFAVDVDMDDVPEPVRWSKPPLEVDAGLFRIIGVHAKSKAPHGAKDPEAIRAISIANRRKQMAQCLWLRRRITAHLAGDEDLIVLGDFNDGPGLDEYERLFGRSGVEIVLGDDLHDPHARMALAGRFGARPTTARFYLAPAGQYVQALLDYIMLSPRLARRARWRIWHPFDDPHIWEDAALRGAVLTASDHFPVTVDLDLERTDL